MQIISPKRFQAGFGNYAGVAGMESSLRYILCLGINNTRKKKDSQCLAR